MQTDPSPLDSATVILLRERQGACEVLLLERHAQSRAFGGAHVFPGGRVDVADQSPIFAHTAPGFSPSEAARRLGGGLESATALALWIAAIRELFEEAGVLLAARDGVPLDFDDTACRTHFNARRENLLAGSISFEELVTQERLTLMTDALVYFSRWITPAGAPRRFDARFFVARLPAGQEPRHDDQETTATLWRTPAGALAEAERGTLMLAPPTVRTLEDLDTLGSLERILDTVRARPYPTILPIVATVCGQMTIVYPGDAAYERAAAGAAIEDDPPGPRNRALMEGGRWRGQQRTKG
jgi:8-oxo-dGTP pyrophosphatase MutT (NUDIX family)